MQQKQTLVETFDAPLSPVTPDFVVLDSEQLALVVGGAALGPGAGWADLVKGPGTGW
jgi:hypothetical protein